VGMRGVFFGQNCSVQITSNTITYTKIVLVNERAEAFKKTFLIAYIITR
jgi:hypothetical protein